MSETDEVVSSSFRNVASTGTGSTVSSAGTPAAVVGSGGTPAGGAPTSCTAADGDWTCEECDNVNFARRTACNRCSKPRPAAALIAAAAARKKKLGTEIGKAAAEKSRGLFSADDWQCNKCGNVNWARRQQCNVCNAPKFGDVEERTGFGGGYNDRGVVEYKERQSDSDDEYDEFGRRKKRRDNGSVKSGDGDSGGKSNSSNNSDRVKLLGDEERVKKKDEEDEEDEDEDDEDGDLSKYDLSDWGDVAPAARKSRSRSSSSSDSRSRSPINRK